MGSHGRLPVEGTVRGLSGDASRIDLQAKVDATPDELEKSARNTGT
jgi:hypothetical protein